MRERCCLTFWFIAYARYCVTAAAFSRLLPAGQRGTMLRAVLGLQARKHTLIKNLLVHNTGLTRILFAYTAFHRMDARGSICVPPALYSRCWFSSRSRRTGYALPPAQQTTRKRISGSCGTILVAGSAAADAAAPFNTPFFFLVRTYFARMRAHRALYDACAALGSLPLLRFYLRLTTP